MNQTVTTVITAKPSTAVNLQSFVSPSELCDTQRRNMAYDAFSALSAHGF